MNRSCLRLVLAALLATILTGCAAPPAPVVYHSLLGADAGAAATARADGPALVVGPVSVPDLLHNTRLATGSDGRFQLAEQHRWAGAVDREIGRALAERLAAELATERVTLFPQLPPGGTAWQVQLEVLALDGTPGESARLDVRWTLLLTRPERRRHPPRPPWSSPHWPNPALAPWVAGQRTNLARLGAAIAARIRERGNPLNQRRKRAGKTGTGKRPGGQPAVGRRCSRRNRTMRGAAGRRRRD